MSCTQITPEMSGLLTALRAQPVGPELLFEIRAMPEWDEARAWGWVRASGELTGTGWRHLGEHDLGTLPR